MDTALVGRLGAAQLGALAIGTAAFMVSFWAFSFLAYGTTPRVATALGRGDDETATRVGVQGLFVAVAIGAVVTVAGIVLAGSVVEWLGADAEVRPYAEPYLRIRMLSTIPVLVVTVGHGWLRGAHDTRTAMAIVVTGAAVNAVLDYLFIYPMGWGVEGAAWATVIGQLGAAIAFWIVLARRFVSPSWRPHRETMRSFVKVAGDLIARTGLLLGGLTLATAVAARMGVVELASWQVAMQVFTLLAFTLDSVAIAAQAMIGRAFGSGSIDRSRELATRFMQLGLTLGVALLVVLLATRGLLAKAFSDDPAVVAAVVPLLAWVALIQPLSGAAFTLDGILIGASDTRFLAGAMACASAVLAAIAWLSLESGWGTTGLAVGITAWLAVRTILLKLRMDRIHAPMTDASSEKARSTSSSLLKK